MYHSQPPQASTNIHACEEECTAGYGCSSVPHHSGDSAAGWEQAQGLEAAAAQQEHLAAVHSEDWQGEPQPACALQGCPLG